MIQSHAGVQFRYYKSSKPCVGAVLVKDTQILLIRRANEPFKDFWDFPGGFLNYGEHPEQGLNGKYLKN